MPSKKKDKIEKIQAKHGSFHKLITTVGEEADHLAGWVKHFVRIGKKIKELLTSIILYTAGFGVIGIGLGIYIGGRFPELENGISHILVGIFYILIAAGYSIIISICNGNEK
jgi:hypothetical protein